VCVCLCVCVCVCVCVCGLRPLCLRPVLLLLPQARRWRGCTAWRGRTWRRWRPCCWAWARPASPSSSPSHASSPLCEARRGNNSTRRTSCGTEERAGRRPTQRPFGSRVEEEAGNALDPFSLLLDLKAMLLLLLLLFPPGVSRVASLLRANSLLWDVQMPFLWPLTFGSGGGGGTPFLKQDNKNKKTTERRSDTTISFRQKQ